MLFRSVIAVVTYGGIVAVTGNSPDALALGAAALAGLAPDIDHRGSRAGMVLWPLADWIETRYGHRTVTHSLLGTLLFALLCTPLLLFPSTRSWFGASFIGYLSHLFADAATKSGVPLLWPNRARFVFPGNSDFRVKTGSMAEGCILVAFIAIGALMIPVAKAGPRRLLHIAMGDLNSALRDQEDYGRESETVAQLKGYDTLNQTTVEGRFRVVGRRGDGGLVVERSGTLWLVKETGDETYRIKPRHIRIYAVKARRTKTQAVRVGNLTLGALARLLPPGSRITGEARCYPSTQPHRNAPPIGVKTVSFSTEKVITFDFATPEHLRNSSPQVAIHPTTVTLTYPQQKLLPRLLWPSRHVVVVASHMRRHGDLLVEFGQLVTRGQRLNQTFAQRIEKPPLEITPDPALALAAAEKRDAMKKVKALDIEENAMRQTSVWPQFAESFASRRRALENAASQVVPVPPKPQPTFETWPQASSTRSPFNAVVERVEWEAPTIPQEKGERPEYSAQISLVEIQP